MADFVDEIIDFEEWSFPVIELAPPPDLVTPEIIELPEIAIGQELTSGDNNVNSQVADTIEPEVFLSDDELAATDTIIDKEALLDERIQYLDSICAKISEQLLDCEQALFSNMVRVIQKSVRKIISKELSLDQNLFKTMLEEAMSRLNIKDHPCVIFVSKDDLHFTEQNIFLNNVQFKVDQTLEKGDFIIENKFVTLEAVLEDRINILFSNMREL